MTYNESRQLLLKGHLRKVIQPFCCVCWWTHKYVSPYSKVLTPVGRDACPVGNPFNSLQCDGHLGIFIGWQVTRHGFPQRRYFFLFSDYFVYGSSGRVCIFLNYLGSYQHVTKKKGCLNMHVWFGLESNGLSLSIYIYIYRFRKLYPENVTPNSLIFRPTVLFLHKNYDTPNEIISASIKGIQCHAKPREHPPGLKTGSNFRVRHAIHARELRVIDELAQVSPPVR